jgi:hypothetical protein
MNVARAGQRAALLANGKVLAVGGDGDNGNLASAELYDPATGTWSLTGSMTTTRVAHTMTRLADGRVLVAGGLMNFNTYLSSAEIYDPATGVWTATGSMSVKREDFTATLLSNGKVLVAGGYLFGDASCELYDPASGTWSPTGSMNAERNGHKAVLLNDGTVLVAGGETPSLLSTEIYDPATGTWSLAGDLMDQRTAHTLTRLADGTALVAGGNKFPTIALDSAEIYTPAFVEPMNVDGSGTFTTSGGTASFTLDVSGTHGTPTGSITYKDRDANVVFGRVTFRRLSISGNTATITGKVVLANGGGNVSFSATAVDSSTDGSSDTFSIILSNGYSESGTLTSGNITIH